jgi:hypothetical protein
MSAWVELHALVWCGMPEAHVQGYVAFASPAPRIKHYTAMAAPRNMIKQGGTYSLGNKYGGNDE